MPNDSLWPRAKQILNDLLEAAPDDPDAWLEERCEGESVLRNEVESYERRAGIREAGDDGRPAPLHGEVRTTVADSKPISP